METLFLVTDSLENTSSSLKALESKVSDLASRIEGYDTICDDFDFGAAKSVLTNNMSACATKIMNTAYVIQNVSESHTKLQKTLKYGEEEPSTESSSTGSSGGGTNYNTTSSSDSNDEKSSGATRIDSRNSSSGSGNSYNYSRNNDTNILGAAGIVGVNTNPYFDKLRNITDDDAVDSPVRLKNTDDMIDFSLPTVIENNKITSAGMATVIEDNLVSTSKEFLSSNVIELEGGLMKTDNRYIISCDSSIGKVGDVIKITKDDGNIIECIVGVETSGSKNPINFLVADKNEITIENRDFCNNLLNGEFKIEKYTKKIGSNSYRRVQNE